MTPNRDYDIPIRLLPVLHGNAADGQTVSAAEVGGLVREERVLSVFTADPDGPTLKCTLYFPSDAATLDGLTVAGMVLGVVTTLSDAEKTLGGTGLAPRESHVSESGRTLTLRLAPTSAPGAAERLRALSTAFASGDANDLAARMKRVCPAVTRFEVAA